MTVLFTDTSANLPKEAYQKHNIRVIPYSYFYEDSDENLALSDFDGYDYFAFPEIYERITTEDVRQLIAREIVPEQAVLSLILPKNREEA